ncbi:hypothetical protein SAMN02745248_01924 [Hathewaya proteolytica DSM 3090]|uniref:Uncharacterized protein n=1 Tax=Hathewaya proteolytica DSM 3090 TaxID=1121331 RepID=A0A1M6Q773_9CLOT|nr:hypothetical protein [Hathewaya proteolytica]SHK16041.1 hypothetical protein SAMN02745248_01924 [Hathewaya proteolytica DSM 3090]
MKKVSIFSKDYEKIMKRRKRIRAIAIVIISIALLIGGILYLNLDSLKKLIAKKNNVDPKGNITEIVKDISSKENTKVEDISADKDEIKEKVKEDKVEERTAVLENGFKIDYTVDTKTQSIDKLKEDGNYTYQLSQDKKMAIVFFNKTSQLFSLNEGGIVKNLSYDLFVTTKGKRVSRNDFLKQNPSFIWMESPRLYKDKVYYATKLPNLNNNNRYFLWICDVSTGKHRGIFNNNYRANKIQMGQITSKGLEIILDGKARYFNENGTEVK